MARAIREDIVDIHDARGDLAASSDVLRDIESQLGPEDSEEVRAQNLLAQGRLLVSTYRPREAIEVLTRALAELTRIVDAGVDMRATLAGGDKRVDASIEMPVGDFLEFLEKEEIPDETGEKGVKEEQRRNTDKE